MAGLNASRWFLPETPDVLGLLRRQIEVTIEGSRRFASWAGGEDVRLEEMREIQARGEVAKRDLLNALRTAFITPIEPEDLFSISQGAGRILGATAGLVGEAAVLECDPDEGLAGMAGLIVESLTSIESAVARLDSSGTRATEEADRAIESARQMSGHYYRGMAVTLDLEDRGQRIARRELYRRCLRIGDTVVDVAERVVYSVVKQS
jgi:uncharacterized protein Yka (UPF0111/DUF47 family)